MADTVGQAELQAEKEANARLQKTSNKELELQPFQVELLKLQAHLAAGAVPSRVTMPRSRPVG